MKIGVNTLFFIPGEVGGSETYLRQTLMAMAVGFPLHEFVLFTNIENEPLLRRDLAACTNVRFVPLRFRAMNRGVRIIREQTQLGWKVARSGVDILWSPGYVAPFSCGCPQVVTIYDMQYRRFPEDLGSWARFVTDRLIRVSVRRCRRILTISRFSQNEILHFTRAHAGRMDVTPAGVSPFFKERATDSEHADALRLTGDASSPFILAVANTYPHKNIHTLIRAYAQSRAASTHRLVMVGNPRRGEPDVEAAMRVLDNPARLTRLMKLTHTQLRALYQAASLFVFPSRYEGFGLPVLEAMLARTRVLTTRCASIPEVGGDTVSYFDENDAADCARSMDGILAESDATRQPYLDAARTRAAVFTWEETARRTLACFEKALRSGPA
jgi:glycosyltransferase involved in cell wall biosynthesis